MENSVSSSSRMNDSDKYTSESWLFNFYNNADAFITNKFHIGLSGEYVEKALTIMEVNSKRDKYSLAQKKFKDSTPLAHRFNQWIKLHWNKNTRMLSMFWNCKSVTLPTPTITLEDLKGLDKYKTLNYKMAKSVESGQDIQLNIVDNQYLMWTQFFNSLFNAQIDPLVLKPASTFHKIKMNIEILGGQLATNNDGTINTTDLDVFQMYEYNSIVLKTAPVVNADNSQQTMQGFTINFSCPNALNGTFKTMNRGLMDNTTTKEAIVTKNGTFEYNTSFWEWDSKAARANSARNYDALSAKDETEFIRNKNLYVQK